MGSLNTKLGRERREGLGRDEAAARPSPLSCNPHFFANALAFARLRTASSQDRQPRPHRLLGVQNGGAEKTLANSSSRV